VTQVSDKAFVPESGNTGFHVLGDSMCDEKPEPPGDPTPVEEGDFIRITQLSSRTGYTPECVLCLAQCGLFIHHPSRLFMRN
jgi:hypothetical protein